METELAWVKSTEDSDSEGNRVASSSSREGTVRSVSEHMDPDLWSNLPDEILNRVLSRLPLTQIISLECLGRHFSGRQFRQLCASAELHPNMLALVRESQEDCGVFDVKLLDVTSRRWHDFQVKTRILRYFDTMHASDGGLVCFVSKDSDKVESPLAIVVVNPLTREWKRVPIPPLLSLLQLILVQLVMDRNTKCYHVLVVANEEFHLGGYKLFAQVYNSATGEWTDATTIPNLVFGFQFHWDYDIDPYAEEFGTADVLPCVFDCARTELINICEPLLYENHPYALLNDRLFVLKEEPYQRRNGEMNLVQDSRFAIAEYQGRKGCPHWVQVRVHECCEFASSPHWKKLYCMSLFACKDFLMVSAEDEIVGVDSPVRVWLYDLSKCTWQELPTLPDRENEIVVNCDDFTMCELRWDAVP